MLSHMQAHNLTEGTAPILSKFAQISRAPAVKH